MQVLAVQQSLDSLNRATNVDQQWRTRVADAHAVVLATAFSNKHCRCGRVLFWFDRRVPRLAGTLRETRHWCGILTNQQLRVFACSEPRCRVQGTTVDEGDGLF